MTLAELVQRVQANTVELKRACEDANAKLDAFERSIKKVGVFLSHAKKTAR